MADIEGLDKNALKDKIKTQGEVIRKLKSEKASKEKVINYRALNNSHRYPCHMENEKPYSVLHSRPVLE